MPVCVGNLQLPTPAGSQHVQPARSGATCHNKDYRHAKRMGQQMLGRPSILQQLSATQGAPIPGFRFKEAKHAHTWAPAGLGMHLLTTDPTQLPCLRQLTCRIVLPLKLGVIIALPRGESLPTPKIRIPPSPPPPPRHHALPSTIPKAPNSAVRQPIRHVLVAWQVRLLAWLSILMHAILTVSFLSPRCDSTRPVNRTDQ